MTRSSTSDELMTIAAARALSAFRTCFVGIGLPSTAANLARRLHNPRLVLIYESGTLGSKPARLPLSIGDGGLAETADSVVSVPEIFNYWLQPGRIDVGFLGAAQLDVDANINTTVIGPSYENPAVRLPGAGGAPEIAANCRQVLVVVRQTTRTFVRKVDFVTSRCSGPVKVITDLGILERGSTVGDGLSEGGLRLTAIHAGVELDDALTNTGWDLEVATDLAVTDPPTDRELDELLALKEAA